MESTVGLVEQTKGSVKLSLPPSKTEIQEAGEGAVAVGPNVFLFCPNREKQRIVGLTVKSVEASPSASLQPL